MGSKRSSGFADEVVIIEVVGQRRKKRLTTSVGGGHLETDTLNQTTALAPKDSKYPCLSTTDGASQMVSSWRGVQNKQKAFLED